ncbi:sensor histidine kinase [Paenibacillus roseipurpureus]|uniref:Sensor histidine kinase n=1 Tax=Paenibacillus roseopurpureus TaxID=2918901 RepID=A0AA96LU61_9BACL|nr:sensor histidine kinase [Paenibacillus sp. MBLB1832]WNR46149.1 sensor histidine kinase [Paenibacillus sp. MBLB1832]
MLEKFNGLSTFAKINVILLVMLTPLVLLNYYSNHTGNKVVRGEILRSSETNLALLTNQIDHMADQISVFALTMIRDSSVRTYRNQQELQQPYDKLHLMSTINEKLQLNGSSLLWNNQISIYFPSSKEVVSTTGGVLYDEQFIQNNFSPSWTYLPSDYRYGQPYFIRHLADPMYVRNQPIRDYQVITEASFTSYNLVKMLDEFKTKGNVHDPFLFKPGYKPILSNTSDTGMIAELEQHLPEWQLQNSGSETIRVGKGSFLITYKLSETLGWYMVDYVPLSEALAPMERSSRIFIGSVVILIALGLTLSYFIYRHVQAPIMLLVSSARAIARGDFTSKVTYHSKNEFYFLISQFNHMASHIKELIETVYQSRIHLQEASLKQLQSQIDPHFLYNSLNFIQYSARSGDEEAIISMALHLGDYYRAATRLEQPLTTLDEELKLIRSYLEIHKLRMHGMQYSIELESTLGQLEVPRLIVQPLVENAIVHGISKRNHPGEIRIVAEQTESGYRISVEDNGPGLSKAERAELLGRIMNSDNEHNMCGLWNVAQRLVLHYGEAASVAIEESELGGFKISLHWPATK